VTIMQAVRCDVLYVRTSRSVWMMAVFNSSISRLLVSELMGRASEHLALADWWHCMRRGNCEDVSDCRTWRHCLV